MTTLISVCARAGSKGVKNKNISKINGIPLIEYTFKQIEKLPFKKIVVVSSDCKKIQKLTKKYKEFLFIDRPKYLAKDSSPKIDVLKHLLKFIKKNNIYLRPEILIDLDPTSPLRSFKDIINAYKLLKKNNECDTVISGYLTNRNPYFNLVVKNKINNIDVCIKKNITYTSRQESPNVYAINSSIYIFKIPKLIIRKKIISKKTLLYEMPHERSLDIDSKFDLFLIRKIYEKS